MQGSKQLSACGTNTDRLLSKEGSLLPWYSLDISTQLDLSPQLSTANFLDPVEDVNSSAVGGQQFSWSPWHSERLQSARLSYVEELGRKDYRRRTPGPDREAAKKAIDLQILRSPAAPKDGVAVQHAAQALQDTAIAQAPAWMWYAVMLLSMGVAFISFLDRAILSVTILPMAAELNFSETAEALIRCVLFFSQPSLP